MRNPAEFAGAVGSPPCTSGQHPPAGSAKKRRITALPVRLGVAAQSAAAPTLVVAAAAADEDASRRLRQEGQRFPSECSLPLEAVLGRSACQ